MRKAGKGRGSTRSPWSTLYQMPILTIGLCLIAAKFLLWDKIPESAVDYLPYIIATVVAVYGGYRGARLAPRHRFLCGLINVIGFSLMLFMGNLLFFGEPFSQIGNMFLWLLIGGVIGSFIANIKKGKIA